MTAWRALALTLASTILVTGCWFGPGASPPPGVIGGNTGGTGGNTGGTGGITGGTGADYVWDGDTSFPAILDPGEPWYPGDPLPPVVPVTGPLKLFQLAGNGQPGFAGDGGPAQHALFSSPSGVAWNNDGLVIADSGNNRARRIGLDGNIVTVAGSGTSGYNGDGPDATKQWLANPARVAMDAQGTIYFSEPESRLVRSVGTSGALQTVVGGGDLPPGPDPITARDADLSQPTGLAFGPDGKLYVADVQTGRILVIADGKVSTHPVGEFYKPTDLAISREGQLAVVDAELHEVYKVAPDGARELILGADRLSSVAGLAWADDGTLFVADPVAHRIFRLATDGTFSAAAETSATAIVAGPRGQFFLVDPANHYLYGLFPG